jgi:CRP/FNR family transcriptional regulator, cyclic AMP receptor protein
VGTYAVSFLDGLADDDRAALVAVASRTRYRAGDHLCHEGDAADVAWVLVGGLVKLVKVARSGCEALIELRGSGEIVGEMGAIDHLPRSASVVALVATDTLVVPSEDLRAVQRAHPAIAERLQRVLVARLRQASFRQLEHATIEVVGRVSERLLELADARGEPAADGTVTVHGISQHELAAWVGASRDSVVRALSALRAAALVESGRGRLVLRDRAALAALTEQP